MTIGGIVVRIASSIGVSRLCLDRNATLYDLKTELAKRISLEQATGYKLTHEDTGLEVTGSDSQPLSALNIVHGTTLNLEHFPSSAAGNATPLTFKSTGESSSNDKSPTANSESAKPQVAENHKDEQEKKTDPNFKSFDAWLKDNGYNLGELPLRQSYKPVVIERGKMNKLPLGLTIKHQSYRHVDHLEVQCVDDIQDFCNYWTGTLQMATQRVGWLYGYYIQDSHYPLGIRAVCEAIYEPPQTSNGTTVTLLPDDVLPLADAIAKGLGLERIGHLFTHLPREQHLSPQDVVDSATIQLQRAHSCHYTGYPVSTHITATLCVGADGNPNLNAYMVSDAAMVLVRDGLILLEQPGNEIQIAKPRHKHEILPQIFISGKEAETIDPDWFVVRVNESAPKKQTSIFKYRDFPRANRNTNIEITQVRRYFAQKMPPNAVPGHSTINSQVYSDFHLLLYIAKTLDLDTALGIVDALVNNEPVDAVVIELLNL